MPLLAARHRSGRHVAAAPRYSRSARSLPCIASAAATRAHGRSLPLLLLLLPGLWMPHTNFDCLHCRAHPSPPHAHAAVAASHASLASPSSTVGVGSTTVPWPRGVSASAEASAGRRADSSSKRVLMALWLSTWTACTVTRPMLHGSGISGFEQCNWEREWEGKWHARNGAHQNVQPASWLCFNDEALVGVELRIDRRGEVRKEFDG